MTNPDSFHLFDVFGIELEYMLVSKETLEVQPLVDELLKKVAGDYVSDYVEGNVGWANELVLHVMEMRNDEPTKDLTSLGQDFLASVQKATELASSLNAQLLPSGMHPWMNPAKETKLWPHEYAEVYTHFDQIFNCRRHGWANLQSCQLNLPFTGDDEFAKLHTVIRYLLPLLPGLASSSPFVEGHSTDFCNNRLEVYKANATRAPLVAGQCIPEALFSKKDYEEKLLEKIYDQIKPLDPDGVLQYEWLNARGAIARFDRDAIEIRILDMQENPTVDIAVCKLITSVLELLISETFVSLDELKRWEITPLKTILDEHIREADHSVIQNKDYLKAFGVQEPSIRSNELWQHLIQSTKQNPLLTDQDLKNLAVISKEGVLSRRILAASGKSPSRQRLTEVYRELANCLVKGNMFHAS